MSVQLREYESTRSRVCLRSVSRNPKGHHLSRALSVSRNPEGYHLSRLVLRPVSRREETLPPVGDLCSGRFRAENKLYHPFETLHKAGFALKNSDTRYVTSVGFARQKWLPPVEDLPSRFRPEELEHPLGLSARKLLK